MIFSDELEQGLDLSKLCRRDLPFEFGLAGFPVEVLNLISQGCLGGAAPSERHFIWFMDGRAGGNFCGRQKII